MDAVSGPTATLLRLVKENEGASLHELVALVGMRAHEWAAELSMPDAVTCIQTMLNTLYRADLVRFDVFSGGYYLRMAVTAEERVEMARAAEAEQKGVPPERIFSTILGKALMGDDAYKEAIETGDTTGLANLRALAQEAFPDSGCRCAAQPKPCGRGISARSSARADRTCWPCWSAAKDQRECFH